MANTQVRSARQHGLAAMCPHHIGNRRRVGRNHGTADPRLLRTAQNLLYRYWLETRTDAPLAREDVRAFAVSAA